jgi:hypothetical protein
MIRQEDLLDAAARIGTAHPDWPVLFLLHHHLVPTPLTDLGPIEAAGSHPAVRFGLEHVLPRIVANADREELTMTALGAGTALSTLHTLGRAVLALHGHKHYATARMLDGTHEGHGDVLVVSAGSAGTAQPWRHGPVERDVARLWPSFNAIELERDLLDVTTVSFGWKGSSTGEVVYRPHVRARRSGAQWLQEPIAAHDDEPARLERNESVYELTASRAHGGRRWDFVCTRRIEGAAEDPPSRYLESIEHEPEADLRWTKGMRGPVTGLPATVELPQGRGEAASFFVEGGVSRTLDGRARDASPYAWLGLMSRYASKRARLEVRGLGSAAMRAFASATDLGSGLERPRPLERNADGALVLDYPSCPARQLLRIYWPLSRAEL